MENNRLVAVRYLWFQRWMSWSVGFGRSHGLWRIVIVFREFYHVQVFQMFSVDHELILQQYVLICFVYHGVNCCNATYCCICLSIMYLSTIDNSDCNCTPVHQLAWQMIRPHPSKVITKSHWNPFFIMWKVLADLNFMQSKTRLVNNHTLGTSCSQSVVRRENLCKVRSAGNRP